MIGRLEIPRLNLAVMVREGADEGTLSRAVGHIPGTALPGNVGNVGLAGHRDTFFRALRNIRADDTIELETTAGTYRYVVKSTRIVTPRDVSVLEASGGETLDAGDVLSVLLRGFGAQAIHRACGTQRRDWRRTTAAELLARPLPAFSFRLPVRLITEPGLVEGSAPDCR